MAPHARAAPAAAPEPRGAQGVPAAAPRPRGAGRGRRLAPRPRRRAPGPRRQRAAEEPRRGAALRRGGRRLRGALLPRGAYGDARRRRRLRAARRRPAARARGAPRALRGREFAALPGPRIQDDDVAAAAAALEAAGNDAATHALALAVVPLVCCQKATAAPATAAAFAAACTRAVADEEALDGRLASWLESRVPDAGAIDARARGRGRRGGDDATFRRRFRVQASWSAAPPVARYRRPRQPAAVHCSLGRNCGNWCTREWLIEVKEATAKARELSEEEGCCDRRRRSGGLGGCSGPVVRIRRAAVGNLARKHHDHLRAPSRMPCLSGCMPDRAVSGLACA